MSEKTTLIMLVLDQLNLAYILAGFVEMTMKHTFLLAIVFARYAVPASI